MPGLAELRVDPVQLGRVDRPTGDGALERCELVRRRGQGRDDRSEHLAGAGVLNGEPKLVGDGYARIGEGSGSTNVLTGSGVDEAWTTGVQLAEAWNALTVGTARTQDKLDRARALGAIIGKALMPLRTGRDLVPVLIALQ